MKVYLKNYRQSPRKVRLVADMIRGKSVPAALTLLSVVPKRATVQLEKTLRSALANAKQHGMTDTQTLRIQEIRVDKGVTLHRYLPRAQGRATRFDKHSSNITLVLGESTKKQSAVGSQHSEKKAGAKKVSKPTVEKKSAKIKKSA